MNNDWAESGAVETGLTLTFDGINLDEQDALDMENFARGVKEPAKEDPGGKAFAATPQMRSRAMSPMDAIKLGLAAVAGLITFVIVGELKVSSNVGYPAVGVAAVLGFLAPTIVTAVLSKKAEPVQRMTQERFVITVSRDELSVEGERAPRVAIPVAEIDRVDGAGRLTVRTRDGRVVTLVCGLKSKFHPPLADRLNALLAPSVKEP